MEHVNPLLIQAAVYFAAAVAGVAVSHRLGLGSVAGYLLAGIAIGPWGLNVVGQVEDVRAFAELGIVFLLFVIGLELEPGRLWEMRGQLVRLGLSQLAVSIAAIAGIAWMLGVDPRIGVVIGMALALSSTAFALQPLTERGGLATRGGQATFAVLLFQDLAVIPMLALLPLFGSAAGVTSFSWHGLGVAVLVIAATLIGGHYIARPVFRHIARTRLREVFTEFALLLVIVIALGFASAGLSMALGAFLAGMLLADSEYRHEIEAVLEPFKGLLMGLFFIAVGMTVDFGLLLSRPLAILGVIVGFGTVKAVILWVIAREARLPVNERPLFILLLAQGGEFAFLLVGLGAGQDAIPREVAQAVTLAVALSMLLTPFLLALHDQVLVPRLAEQARRPADEVPQLGKVIVAGLGRVGQVVARVLHASGYEPTVLDDNPDHVEQSRKFGFRAFYGDATRLDLLQAAGADRAEYLIIALDNPRATSSLARTAKEHFPNLRVVARARDMRHLFELRDLGVELIERETFRSALNLAERALSTITGDAERARRAARAFGRHDVEVVKRLYEVHRNQPDAHVTVSNELRDQLARTLRADEARMATGANGEVDPKSG
jgi:glutathione-regulated potassium-efflux system ancillary protein KefC